MNCCDEYGNCNQGRDCPVRVKRVAEAKARLDREDLSFTRLIIGRLALAVAIFLAIFIGSLYHEAIKVVA
jgi:hypothetical protein